MRKKSPHRRTGVLAQVHVHFLWWGWHTLGRCLEHQCMCLCRYVCCKSVFDISSHIWKHNLRRACTCARVCAVFSLAFRDKGGGISWFMQGTYFCYGAAVSNPCTFSFGIWTRMAHAGRIMFGIQLRIRFRMEFCTINSVRLPKKPKWCAQNGEFNWQRELSYPMASAKRWQAAATWAYALAVELAILSTPLESTLESSGYAS